MRSSVATAFDAGSAALELEEQQAALLVDVDLSYNDLEDADVAVVADAIVAGIVGGMSSGSGDGGNNNEKPPRTTVLLRALNLSNNEIGPDGAKAVVEMLEKIRCAANPNANAMPPVVELDLSGNRLGDEGATIVSKALAAKSEDGFGVCPLVGLSLGENDITDAGCAEVAGAVKVNSTLKSLVLTGNDKITTERGVKSMEDAIRYHNCTLETINVVDGGDGTNGELGAMGAENVLAEAAHLKLKNGVVSPRADGDAWNAAFEAIANKPSLRFDVLKSTPALYRCVTTTNAGSSSRHEAEMKRVHDECEAKLKLQAAEHAAALERLARAYDEKFQSQAAGMAAVLCGSSTLPSAAATEAGSSSSSSSSGSSRASSPTSYEEASADDEEHGSFAEYILG